MKTATFVRDRHNCKGEMKLYRVSPPVEYGYDDDASSADYVIVSAAVAPFSGPETYIFPANEAGEVVDWGELDGSFKGGLDHTQALEDAGYTIEYQVKNP